MHWKGNFTSLEAQVKKKKSLKDKRYYLPENM